MNRPRYPVWLLAVLLVAVTILGYWPATSHAFVNYDDPSYVTSNPHVQTGLTWDNVKWAFCHPVVGNWLPLTMLSHMLDCQLYGLKPWGHHLTNMLLHGANTALVFLLLRLLTGAVWRSLMVAMLFGLHPLHVESVAWVAERKDVLSTFFGLLGLLAYTRYAVRSQARNPKSKRGNGAWRYYWLALGLLALGLMSKPMLVTMPFVLLLLDYWPLQRFKASTFQRLLIEKTPFFALAAVMSVVTYVLQQHAGATHSLENVPLQARVGNALVSYCRYLGKLFWPSHLAVFYPYPGHFWPMDQVLLAGAALAGISVFVFVQRKRHPYLLTGWLWFGGTLVPVIGLVQVGAQSMADRYTYLPSLGILIMIVWGATELARRWRHGGVMLTATGVVAVILCLVATWRQLGHWQNSETLFRWTLGVTRNNFIALNGLGMALDDQGRTGEAIGLYQKAIRLDPVYAAAHNNLGCDLDAQGKTDEAIGQYQAALRLNPNYADAHFNLGDAFYEQSRMDEAIAQFRRALELKPDDPTTLAALGIILAQRGDGDEAKACFQKALQISPQNPLLHNSWGKVLLDEGQSSEAIHEFQKALALQPDFAPAVFNLGNAYRQMGHLTAAVQEWQQAVAIDPHYAAAHNNLGNALLLGGRPDLAIRQFQSALKNQPHSVDARNNLAWVLATCPEASLRNGAEALSLAQRANQLTGGKSPLELRTLAAACAENGDYQGAVSNAELAVRLATSRNQTALAQAVQAQLGYYHRHQPFRDPALAPR